MTQEEAQSSGNTGRTRFLDIAVRRSITISRLTMVSTILLLLALYLIVSSIPEIYLTASLSSYIRGDYQACEQAAARAYWWKVRGINPVAWVQERRPHGGTAWEAVALKGIAIFKQGRIADAYAYLSFAATQIRPDLANSWLETEVRVSAGIAAVTLGYYEEACIYLRRAAKDKARQTEAWYYLGEALYGMGNHEAAERVWRDVVKAAEEPWSSKARERLRSIRGR